jgi:hypothetical protein
MDRGPSENGGAFRDKAVVAIRGLMLVRPRPADAPGGERAEDALEAAPEALSEEAMRRELETLRERHRDLDVAIEALAEKGTDPLAVRRLKKRKLMLRDRIAHLEDQLTPDIIA